LQGIAKRNQTTNCACSGKRHLSNGGLASGRLASLAGIGTGLLLLGGALVEELGVLLL